VFSPIRKVRAISVVLTFRHDSRQIPIASDAPPRTHPAVSSIGGLRTPAPCARHHRHGAGIRKPSQKRSFHNRLVDEFRAWRTPLKSLLPTNGIFQRRWRVPRVAM
jgi:hypothetical protein